MRKLVPLPMVRYVFMKLSFYVVCDSLFIPSLWSSFLTWKLSSWVKKLTLLHPNHLHLLCLNPSMLLLRCTLKESHLNNFRKRFQFLTGIILRLTCSNEKVCAFAHSEVYFYEAFFQYGLRFLVYPSLFCSFSFENCLGPTCAKRLEDNN